MSSSPINKLQILWDHFIRSESQSYEKSCWLDVFLAELLALVNEGHDVKDALSFCSVGEGGVATLVGCELLADVHRLCHQAVATPALDSPHSNTESELQALRVYLTRERGWRCLAILHLLGVRELSCARELVALLIALYPLLAYQDPHGEEEPRPNPYLGLDRDDADPDSLGLATPRDRPTTSKRRKKKRLPPRSFAPGRRETRRAEEEEDHRGKDGFLVRQRRCRQNRRSVLERQVRSGSESEQSESDEAAAGRLLALKLRLNTVDFEHSEDEPTAIDWEPPTPQPLDQHLDPGPSRGRWLMALDERGRAVLERTATRYEVSLVVLRLLLGLPDATSAVLVIKFALDSLWSLQFTRDGPFSGLERAGLRAAAARLVLTSLERALRTNGPDEPTGPLVREGLLPVTIKLLEDACAKLTAPGELSPEEATFQQEFIFATLHSLLSFLLWLPRRSASVGGASGDIGDGGQGLRGFLELLRLFNASQGGRLAERAVLLVLRLPGVDAGRSVSRARKLVEMLGLLVVALKRARHGLAQASRHRRLRSRNTRGHGCPPSETCDHHHADELGAPYHHYCRSTEAVSGYCSVSALFATLAALLRESPGFGAEFQLRLVKVMSSSGACCCFPPKVLLASAVSFLKRANSQAYQPTAALLERVVFKELGGYPYPEDEHGCELCAAVPADARSWDFVELYSEILSPDNEKLCHATMRHLLRVTADSGSPVKQELLFRVYYPTFVRVRAALGRAEAPTLKFLVQSCLSAITGLIVNASTYQRFLETNGLQEVLGLLADQAFVKNVYALLEISVIMEIKIASFGEEVRLEGESSPRPATRTLFEFLERGTDALLNALHGDSGGDVKAGEDNPERRAVFHQASGVWRAVAGVVLCSPKFRSELKDHPIFGNALSLTEKLATSIAAGRFDGGNKFATRLFEAILTCCLVASIPNENDIIDSLASALINPTVKLNQGVGSIVEILLQISMLRPSQEQIVPQQNRTRLSTVTMDFSADWEKADDSSPGEYITADDGYEADVEVPIKTHPDVTLKRVNHLGSASELIRGNANAHPTLCSLAIDLLIYFAKQGLGKERVEVIVHALRRVSIICKESISSCAALAGTGAIMRLLQGFQSVLENRNPEYEELQHAVLELFTLLAMRSISPAELVSYLACFKAPAPPLLALLQPLYRLVLTAKPQPNFILSFPTTPLEDSVTIDWGEIKNQEKAESLVNNFRRKHLAQEVCSPWSVHAVCLPVSSEISWSVWLQGCSASLWLRVERGGMSTSNRGLQVVYDSTLSSESDSLSDWGLLSDNWSREVFVGSSTPPMPTSILHMLSIGFESLVLESWLDLKSDKLILRLTRPDDKANRTISETSINGMLPSGRWHHLALNLEDTILNKHSAVVEVAIWVDGWKEIRAQLPFDGLLVRKPGTTCVMVGQVGQSAVGAWYLGNVMLFRCPVFDNKKALYLASLGPNYTNLAECILSSINPDFATLIASGALNGVQELKTEYENLDSNKKKSYGGAKYAVELCISDSKVDWDSLMDATSVHLSDLQDSLLLSFEAQKPHIVHLYPQSVASANGTLVKNLFPSQPGFRVISVPENKVSQQPPLSLPSIAVGKLQCQSYKGLVSSASLIGGIPVFLYLFARVVELDSKEEEQAMALSVALHLARSDSEMLTQYSSEGGAFVLLKVLESRQCFSGKHMLKSVLDATCDFPILVKDAEGDSHLISQNSEAVIIDPELMKCALEAWRTWAMHNTLNLLIEAMLFLLKDQHPHREFNASQLKRARIVESILVMCKEHFLYEDVDVSLDASTGSAIVELLRALMGAPPEFSHLVLITDYLILVHKATETYVTHSRHNMYFLLQPLEETRSSLTKSLQDSMSSETINTLENSKLNKALANEQIQKGSASRVPKDEEFAGENDASSQGQDTSAGEDSGIAASEGSNQQANEKQPSQADKKRACQGLVCEGLLLLLRDALRVLPDSQIGSALKQVFRVELLLVLSNNPDARVRTALVKVIQVYLQRASDELVNKFIKQKYFVHLAHQISLYPGSEPLVVTLENLALKIPGLAAMPPVLAMIPRAAATDVNVAKPLVSFVTELITKTSNALKVLLEQGLMESIGRSITNGAHVSGSSSLYRDLHVLLVTIATKLLDAPGNYHMHTVAELHVVLNYAEFKERAQCGANKSCVSAVRDAQVALFDGELDILTSKVSSHSGFRLKSTASYIASISYTTALTTSSEHSDHGSRSLSYSNLPIGLNSLSREPGKGELNDRFRMTLNRVVDFLTTADDSPSVSELQLSKRLFAILLHGISSPLNKKSYWVNAWSAKSALRKNTARIMVWLMGPHQSNGTRVYAVRTLMEEPKTKEILTTLLEVHPQIEQKFSVFFWDLLQKRDEMSCADARMCLDLEEALQVWELAKKVEQNSSETWTEELALLRRELTKERNAWIENQLAAIQRMSNKFEPLAKQLTESAMSLTRTVVEEQNRERKLLMEKFKYTRSLEARVMAQWRDIIKRLTHERAPWYFPERYPTSWELDPTEGPARVRMKLQRCHLNLPSKFFLPEHKYKSEASAVEPPMSFLFNSGKPEASVSMLIERLHTSEKIQKMSPAKVVTPQADLSGEALIGETCFYFVPDTPSASLHTDIALGGLDLAMAGGTVWRLEDIRELHRRRYQLQDRAIEIFLITGRTYLMAFDSPKEREEFVLELSKCNLPRRVPGDDLGEALNLWRNGTLTNWEYITCLNKLAGRSYNDLMQYPVFPFVLADYTSEKINLENPSIYRNFKKPMAVQDKKNEQHYINNYNYLKQSINEGVNLIALNKEPFHYGSHYSNSGTVLHFLVRLPPFTSMFLNYQDDSFDIPDRTFHAIATTWRLTSCDSTTDVKELIPEFFYLPEFLLNYEGFDFGVRQNGCPVGDVELPKWSGGDARLFVLAHRAALESDVVREVLPYWIDLVFGFRQTGKPAVEAINVFHPATYYGFDAEQIQDPLERQAFETMVKTYGQTPAQLFKTQHQLPAQNLALTADSDVFHVMESVEGIKWGNYVGAPSNEPNICWKHKYRIPLASLVPLATGEVFGLPACTTLILAYSKGNNSMLSSISVQGAGLISWNSSDGIARMKTKKEQPPKPLIRSLGLDSISIMKSSPDCEQLWIGYVSGRIVVYTCTVTTTGKIEFSSASPSVLLAHRNRVTFIELSQAFRIAVSGDTQGILVIWDLNSLTYVRSIIREDRHPITSVSISETLGDIAIVYQISNQINDGDHRIDNQSELRVFTVNARVVGSVVSKRRITALCYSNAVEGISVNVIATGLDNGIIRLWSSWDLRLVREISSGKGCGRIIGMTWSCDQHHFYASTSDCTVIIWDGDKKLHNGTPKFFNLAAI
ncbi:lysosomal-trafficking regulator [Copidosoma floridanum]|uniref:lysosomal-trafficking regulator n=1 Tax=Copidosoma floridanum TaxID=29053 RepID=UPI000C6FA7CE|nr:lysosomal-trafficking regulator [Copidosoma floridanum]